LYKEVDALDEDGSEEDLPGLAGRHGSVGGAMGVHELPDFTVVPERGANEVTRCVRAGVGVGEGKASEDAYKAGDGHLVGNGV
jgi:hypothetical protein